MSKKKNREKLAATEKFPVEQLQHAIHIQLQLAKQLGTEFNRPYITTASLFLFPAFIYLLFIHDYSPLNFIYSWHIREMKDVFTEFQQAEFHEYFAPTVNILVENRKWYYNSIQYYFKHIIGKDISELTSKEVGTLIDEHFTLSKIIARCASTDEIKHNKGIYESIIKQISKVFDIIQPDLVSKETANRLRISKTNGELYHKAELAYLAFTNDVLPDAITTFSDENAQIHIGYLENMFSFAISSLLLAATSHLVIARPINHLFPYGILTNVTLPQKPLSLHTGEELNELCEELKKNNRNNIKKIKYQRKIFFFSLCALTLVGILSSISLYVFIDPIWLAMTLIVAELFRSCLHMLKQAYDYYNYTTRCTKLERKLSVLLPAKANIGISANILNNPQNDILSTYVELKITSKTKNIPAAKFKHLLISTLYQHGITINGQSSHSIFVSVYAAEMLLGKANKILSALKAAQQPQANYFQFKQLQRKIKNKYALILYREYDSWRLEITVTDEGKRKSLTAYLNKISAINVHTQRTTGADESILISLNNTIAEKQLMQIVNQINSTLPVLSSMTKQPSPQVETGYVSNLDRGSEVGTRQRVRPSIASPTNSLPSTETAPRRHSFLSRQGFFAIHGKGFPINRCFLTNAVQADHLPEQLYANLTAIVQSPFFVGKRGQQGIVHHQGTHRSLLDNELRPYVFKVKLLGNWGDCRFYIREQAKHPSGETDYVVDAFKLKSHR